MLLHAHFHTTHPSCVLALRESDHFPTGQPPPKPPAQRSTPPHLRLKICVRQNGCVHLVIALSVRLHHIIVIVIADFVFAAAVVSRPAPSSLSPFAGGDGSGGGGPEVSSP